MGRDARALRDDAEAVASRFGQRFAAGAALARDRELADALAVEARPIAEALLEASATTVDPRAPELREALALTSLLGRRAAALGATPTAALAIAPCLIAASEREDLDALIEPLRAVCLEGYVAAREDALREDGARRAADAISVVTLAPGCVAVLVSGDQDADEIERVFEELGRRLLDGGARACLVSCAGLREPDRERARQLFAVHATCTMLGVECTYAGVPDGWREAAREAGLDLSYVRFEPDFASGMRAALFACGLELRARAGIGDVLRRFVAPRRR